MKMKQRTARLLAAAGYLTLAVLPAALLVRVLTMTDLTKGWQHAVVAIWSSGSGGGAWAAALVALVFWAIPLLFKATVFLVYAGNPKANPWEHTLSGSFGGLPRGQARLVAALMVLLVTSPALIILAWNWTSIAAALPALLFGGQTVPQGFAPLAWSFVVATVGLCLLGVVVSCSGNTEIQEKTVGLYAYNKIQPGGFLRNWQVL